MCGVVEGGITPGTVGLRGRAERRGGHLRLGRRASSSPPGYHQRRAREGPRPARVPVGAGGRAGRRRARAGRARLAQRQPLRARRPRAQRRARRAHAGTRAPEDIYRALIEATAFGARMIVETFEAAGLAVEDIVVAGGLLKNPVVMQIYADVLRRPLHLIGSEQGPALGSAIHAAVAAGRLPRHPRRVGGDGLAGARRLRARRAGGRRLRPLYASYVGPARSLRPRRRRRHAPPARARGERSPVIDVADSARPLAPARASCRATGSCPGRAATSPRACPTTS